MNAQCPTWEVCADYDNTIGCNHISYINFSGDATFSSTGFNIDLLDIDFEIIGDGTIISATYSDLSKPLYLKGVSISNTSSTISLNYFNISGTLTGFDLVDPDQITVIVEAEANDCFQIVRKVNSRFAQFGPLLQCSLNSPCTSGPQCSFGITSSGKVYSHSNADGPCPDTQFLGIEGVEIEISTISDVTYPTTNNSGSYTGYTCSSPYEKCVTTTCEESCGVEQIDLDRVQKFILGTLIPTDYQYLASDFDSDGSVNSLDIFKMRKDKLGIPQTIPAGYCRFVETSEFSSFDWQSNSNTLSIDNCTSNQGNTEFVRIMLGDVNGSCDDCIHGDNSGAIPLISNSSFDFNHVMNQVDDKIINFSVNYDISDSEFVRFESNLTNIEYNVDGDILKIMWFTLNEEEFITNNKKDFFSIISNGEKPKLIHESIYISALNDGFYNVTIDDSILLELNENNFYFNNQKIVRNHSGDYEMNLFDINGRSILQRNITEGETTYNMNDNITPGIYLISLHNKHEVITKKVFLY